MVHGWCFFKKAEMVSDDCRSQPEPSYPQNYWDNDSIEKAFERGILGFTWNIYIFNDAIENVEAMSDWVWCFIEGLLRKKRVYYTQKGLSNLRWTLPILKLPFHESSLRKATY